MGARFAVTLLVPWDDPAELALGLIFVSVLTAVTLTDLERRVIPNAVVLAGAVVGIAVVAVADPTSLPQRAIAATAAGGFLLLGALIYRDGMGIGDVKLAALMGLYLGEAVAAALAVGFATGALVGAGLMLGHGATARRRAIPFAPCLALGGLVGLWTGHEIVDWYLASIRE